MASDTFNAYTHFVGDRAERQGLSAACEVFDALPCTDLLTVLTLLSRERSQQVGVQAVIDGNRFHEPSSISQRLFHLIEGEIYAALPNAEFVELSPLQPFGINTVLGGTNEKNVIAALRRSEANADATTALFRLALLRYKQDDSKPAQLATNTRTTRAQKFDTETKFLPHFKVFAETTVGKQNESYGLRELETIADHLANEVTILDRIGNLPMARMAKVSIAIGNVLLMQELVEKGLVTSEEVRRHTITPGYDIFEQSGLDIPREIPFSNSALAETLKQLGFARGRRVLDRFQNIVEERYPELLPRLTLDLGRIAGIGYYKHIAFKISAENNEGVIVPLADGGPTRWAELCTGNKQTYTVTSGIGTELLASYFL